MSSFETSERGSARSVLRHRPISTQAVLIGKRSVITSATIPVVRRASRPRYADTSDDVGMWPQGDAIADDERETYPPVSSVQMQSSDERVSRAGGRMSQTSQQPLVTNGRVSQTSRQAMLTNGRVTQTSRQMVVANGRMSQQTSRQQTEDLKGNVWGTHYRAHPLLYLGIGMLAMLVLWVLLSSVLGWFNTTLDDMRYGRPRTFQMDATVGHNEQNGVPSHFIALNLSGHIEVIEFPAGDATHAHIYMGPQLYGANSDLVPVTLKFMDVNNDQKPDMLVMFQGSQTVFINDQGTFRVLQPNERPQVEQFLQHVSH